MSGEDGLQSIVYLDRKKKEARPRKGKKSKICWTSASREKGGALLNHSEGGLKKKRAESDMCRPNPERGKAKFGKEREERGGNLSSMLEWAGPSDQKGRRHREKKKRGKGPCRPGSFYTKKEKGFCGQGGSI